MNNVYNMAANLTTNLTDFAYEKAKEYPLTYALGAVGVVTITALGYYLSRQRPDLKVIRSIAREIQELKPTIGDGASYPFVKQHGQYIQDEKTKAGTLAMLAAGARSMLGGLAAQDATIKPSELRRIAASYKDNPEEIVALGQDLLTNRSGQCDSMAAAVIAKIVEKIRNGFNWNSRVDLVGSGAHAFVVIGRPEGSDINSPKTWGQAILFDSWLARLGVKEEYADRLTAGEDGVVTNFGEIESNAMAFGAASNQLKVTHSFDVGLLHKLAQKNQ